MKERTQPAKFYANRHLGNWGVNRNWIRGACSRICRRSIIKKSTNTNLDATGSNLQGGVGYPTLFTFTIQTQTGWIENTQEISVYVLSTDGRTYIAMSNICTHLGCHIRWII